jgi:hypothetical protein
MPDETIIKPTKRDYELLGITPPNQKRTELDTGILKAAKVDYEFLGIDFPETTEIEKPTNEEVKSLAGIDLSLGVPIVKRGFFGDRKTNLYTAADDDYQRLGISVDLIVDSNYNIQRRTYQVEEGVAYVNDPKGGLVESIANSEVIESDVKMNGAINLRFTIPGLPVTGIGLLNPEVEKCKKKYGTKFVDSVYPGYEKIVESIPKSPNTGTTSNGLDFILYY